MASANIYQLLGEYVANPEDWRIMSQSLMADSFVPAVADYIHDEVFSRTEAYGELARELRYAVGDTPEEWGQHIVCYHAVDVDNTSEEYNQATLDGCEPDEVMREAFFIFKPTYKQAYFNRRWLQFKERVNNMAAKDFADNTTAYGLRGLIEDRFGSYIAGEEGSNWFSLDKFVRLLSETEETKRWLGSALSYHY